MRRKIDPHKFQTPSYSTFYLGMIKNNSGVSWSNNFRNIVTIMNQEKKQVIVMQQVTLIGHILLLRSHSKSLWLMKSNSVTNYIFLSQIIFFFIGPL